MNVLHVIHYPVFGGPHNQALRLNGALARRGWYTTVLLPDQPGNAAERLRAGGVEVIQLPLHRLRASPDPREQAALALGFLPEVDRIRRLIRRRSIDLVVVGGLANPHAAAAARLEGVPTVWQVLDSRTPAPLRLPLAALVPRLSDTVMAAGRTLLDLHFGPRGPGVPAFVYAPPVDTERFRPSPERRRAARRRLGIPTGAPVVGTVANLNPQKGLEHFVRAAALIHRARPDARFLLVGARYGSHRRYAALLEADVRASGLPPDRLIVTGERADVEEHYPAMDVHLITSVPRSEGTPTTALEAMACGVPVVATRVGAVAEAVEDGVTGLLVPPLDAGAIAGAALRLLEDAPLRDRLGAAGRERAVRRYGVEVCAETHHRAFQVARARFRARRAALMAARPDPLPPPELRSLLVCPACRGGLAWRPGGARCDGCGQTFPVVDGIPVMLLDGARAGHDEVDGHHHAHKERQAAFFDRGVAEEFEVARPHGAPALYR
ncbi:MAG TPA: glycosyltransferase, partial [Dehalococcoidia bacterium]